MERYPGCSLSSTMQSHNLKGAALHRSRLNFVKAGDSLHIRVQFSGAEMTDLRQYWHTWVIGIIDLVSLAPAPGMCRATRERISGGNLFTSCSMSLIEGIVPRFGSLWLSGSQSESRSSNDATTLEARNRLIEVRLTSVSRMAMNAAPW